MPIVAPGELGPESYSSLPPLCPGDEVFTRLFTNYPALNEYANGTAAALCAGALEVPQLHDQQLSPEGHSLLTFGTKKLIFVFTNLEDFSDTLSDDDFWALLSMLHTRVGKSVEKLAIGLNDYANVAAGAYKQLRDGAANQFWWMLSNHERFWMVCGAIFADTQNIPAQRRPH